jgi:hypothetical protein
MDVNFEIISCSQKLSERLFGATAIDTLGSAVLARALIHVNTRP